MKVRVLVLGKTSGHFPCLERHFPFPALRSALPKPHYAWFLATGLLYDLGMKSSSCGMKSLPSVLPRPGHLLSYPTERLFLVIEIDGMHVRCQLPDLQFLFPCRISRGVWYI